VKTSSRFKANVHLGIFLAFSFLLVPLAQAIDRRVVDVVEITWPGAPLPTTSVSEIALQVNDQVQRRWEELTSFKGSKEDKRIQFYIDQRNIQPISLTSPVICDRFEFTSFMNSIRLETYRRLAIENSKERYLLILMPKAGCIWEGLSLIGSPGSRGGTILLQDTSDSFVIAHELGHSLGLGHSNYLRCDGAQRDGTWRQCKGIEYGGTVDLMGNVKTNAPLSTYHQWRMKLLAEPQIKEVWSSETISISAVDMAEGVKALFLRDGESTYWVEYRRERAESGYSSGLVIYRTDPPPSGSVVSPNPQDRIASEFNIGVSSDMWLINLDNFNYANSRSSGSMTLNQGKSFKAYSGNVAFEVLEISSNQDSARVSISRVSDSNPPPKPRLVGLSSQRSSTDSVIESGFEDQETYVDKFEIRRDSQLIELAGQADPAWRPTFLQPLRANKLLTFSDLPEGKYELSIRTIDLAGNRSEWSETKFVNIDRGAPRIAGGLVAEEVSKNSIKLKFPGIRDEGSQLCGSFLYNKYDFVTQASKEKANPYFEFPVNQIIESRIQTSDCLGNATDAKMKLSNVWMSADKGSRTGKWTSKVDSSGDTQLYCSVKCSISLSLIGSVTILAKSSSADVFIAGKKLPPIAGLKSAGLITLELGEKRKLVRISGKDLLIRGVVSSKVEFSEIREILPSSSGEDPTLNLPSQKSLIRLGFKQEDFVNNWRVLPMAGGTETKDPTLDLCGSDYKSENSRLFRRQVAVSKLNSPYLFLSSESVQYDNAESARLALSEVRSKLAECKKRGGFMEVTNSFTSYKFNETAQQEKVLDYQSLVLVHAIIGEGANSRTLFGAYLFKDNYFTGLYVVKSGSQFFTGEEIEGWTQVSKVFLDRLKNV
jgi:hypothetical protein